LPLRWMVEICILALCDLHDGHVVPYLTPRRAVRATGGGTRREGRRNAEGMQFRHAREERLGSRCALLRLATGRKIPQFQCRVTAGEAGGRQTMVAVARRWSG